MNPPTAYKAFLNAAIELSDQLPPAYAAQLIACSQIATTAMLRSHPGAARRLEAAFTALAELLDEVTDALTVQARIGAGG